MAHTNIAHNYLLRRVRSEVNCPTTALRLPLLTLLILFSLTVSNKKHKKVPNQYNVYCLTCDDYHETHKLAKLLESKYLALFLCTSKVVSVSLLLHMVNYIKHNKLTSTLFVLSVSIHVTSTTRDTVPQHVPVGAMLRMNQKYSNKYLLSTQ